MSGKFRKLQKTLKGFIKFKDVLKAIKFVCGANLASLRNKLNNKFEVLQNNMPLFNNDYYSEEYNTGIIFCITEDRGCCGPHNNNIIDYVKTLINCLEDENINIGVYCIGSKGSTVIKKLYYDYYLGSLTDYKDVQYNIDISYIILISILKIASVVYDRIFLVFNRYITYQLQQVACYECNSFIEFSKNLVTKMLIISNEKLSENKNIPYFTTIAENTEIDLNNIYYFSLSLLLSDSLSDNKFSFLASRFFAMQNAIQNVENLISTLTIKFNKARQETITTELTEIITRKEAME